MSKQSSKGKLAAALSPIFKHFAGIIKRLQGNSRPLFNDMESLEGRTLLSGGLLQSFQLPNATVSDAVYDSAGNLHVAFRDQTATNLKYAMRSPGGAWSPVMTVDAASGTGGINSIAMNTNGYPAIAYYDGTNNHLKYAKFDGTAWTTETVDTTANDTGKGASLAITSSGAAVISYLDVTTHDLKVARWITDHWGIAAIDTVGDVGREGTVAINPVSGRYAVVYSDLTNSKLKYAEDTASGVDIRDLDTTVASYSSTSIGFDASGTPSVSYYRFVSAANEKIEYAKRSGAIGTSWTKTDLETGVATAPLTNLAFNVSGGIDVAYYMDLATDEVRVQRWDGSAWHKETMLIGGGTDLAFAENPNGDFTIVSARDGLGSRWVCDWNRDRWLGVYEYLYNNIDFSLSLGSMKGAQATLDSKAGNDWDQASLLIRELAKVGVAASYVTGTVTAPSSDVVKWLGVADANAAESVLDVLDTSGLKTYASQSGSNMTFAHTWVSATTYIPTGTSAKTLDTTWKFKDVSTGITPPVDTVPFSLFDDGDLALLRPATGLAESNYAPVNAVDGDTNTYWWTANESSPTLQVDLGAPFNINRVRVTWGAEFASAYLIETSLDGTTWTTLKNASGQDGGVDDFTALAATTGSLGRYLRVKSTTKGAPSLPGFAIADLRVYGYDDLGRGHTASASTANVSFPASNVSDGNTLTEWRSTAAGTQTIQIDLGSITDISGVRLKWGAGYASAYDIKVSNDALTWKTIESITGGDGTVDQTTGQAARGRYVQISTTTFAGTGTVYSLFDFEILSAPKADESPADIYQTKVRNYLALHNAGESTAHPPRDGPTLAHQFTLSSVTPSYSITTSSTSATIPTNNKQRLGVTLKLNGVTGINNFILNSADVAGQTITISYPATNLPVLQVDGVTVATSTVSAASGTAQLILNVYAGDGNAVADLPYTYDRTVGQPLGIGIQNEQISGPTLATLQAKLNAKAAAAFTDSSQKAGYQDLLVGAAATMYLGEVDKANQTIAIQNGFLKPTPFIGTGIVTGGSTFETHWDLPIPIFAPKMWFDMKGIQLGLASGAAGGATIGENNAAVLDFGWTTSALENLVLSKVVNSPTISTWEGMQMALRSGIPIYEMWQVGPDTKYRLWESGATEQTFNWAAITSSAQKDAIIADLTAGKTVIVPLSSNSATPIVVGDWTGAVWVRATLDGFGAITQTGMLIMASGDTQAHGSAPTNFADTATPGPANNDWYVHFGDPVELSNGSMQHQETDFTRPNVGFPIKFERTYDSLNTDDNGMGVGWSYTYGDKLTFNGSDPTWITANGTKHEFTSDGAGGYNNAQGLFGKLTHGTGEYIYRERDGVEYHFSDTTPYRLTKIQDANGQGVVVTSNANGPTSVADLNDPTRVITFNYNANNKISIVADWNRPVVNVSSITRSASTATVTTSAAHGYVTGNIIEIRGATQPEYNGFFTITVTDSTHFTYTVAGTPVSPATGTITAKTTWLTWQYKYTAINSKQYLTTANFPGQTELLDMSYGYDSTVGSATEGVLKTITNNNDGGTHTYEYYTNKKAFRVTDSEGNQESFSYDLFNHVTQHSDMRGVTTSHAFKSDGLGLEQTNFNPDGSRNDIDWSGTLIQSTVDEIGRKEAYQYYTGTGNVSSFVSKDGLTTSYQYQDNTNGNASGFNFITQVTRPGSRVTDYSYSSTGDLLSQTEHNGAENIQTSFTYPTFPNDRGLPPTRTNPKGNVGSPDGNYTTDYTYNQAGQVLSETTHPASGDITRKYTYDGRGFKTGEAVMTGTTVSVTGVTRSGSTATATTSGSHGYLTGDVIEVRGANQAEYNGLFAITVTGSTTFTYTVSGTPVTPATGTLVSESTVSARLYSYDVFGHLLTVTSPDPDGAGPLGLLVTTNTYKNGNLVSTTDPRGNKTTYAYDRLERLRDVVTPDGARTMTQRYDGLGNPLETVDPLNRSTIMLYDRRGRMTSTVYADDSSKRLRYDAMNRVVSTTNELGKSSALVYDVRDKLASTTDALGQSVTNRYNEVGQLVETVNWPSASDLTNFTANLYSGNLLPVLASGDFDGDGDPDLIRYNTSTGTYAVETMDGTAVTVSYSGTFPDATTTGWKVAGVGDVNNDGVDDILWQHGTINTKNQIWFMSSGIPSITGSYSLPAGFTSPKLVGLKDFDNDGDADPLWLDSLGNVTWYLSSGFGFSNGPAFNLGGGVSYLSEDDVTGDGRADLIVRDAFNNVAFFQTSSISVKSIVAGVLDTNWTIQTTGDMDGSGTADIVWHNNSTGANKLWLMRSDGTHLDITLESDSVRTYVGAADFSQDGRADLIFSDFAANTSGFRYIGGTALTLDPLGRVTQTRGPGGYVTTSDYDVNSNVTNATRYDVTGLTSIPADPRSLSSTLKRTLSTQYDVLDRPTVSTNPDGKTTSSTYDKANRVVTATNEMGRVTAFAYDKAGRKSSTTSPDPDGTGPLNSPVESYTLNANGNLIVLSDPLSHLTKYTYDVLNRQTGQFAMSGTTATVSSLTRSSSTATVTTSAAHNYVNGDVVEIRGANQAEYNGFFTITVAGTTTFTYTVSGTPATPATGTIVAEKTLTSSRMAYDKLGNTISITDGKNNLTTFAYDSRYRKITQTGADPDGAGSQTAPVTSFAYDKAGNLTSMTDPLSHVTSYVYDDLNRQTQVIAPDPDGVGPLTSPTTTTAYLFNNVSQITDPLGHVTSVAYDSSGRKITQTSPDPDGSGPLQSSVVRWGYDALGNLKTVTDAMGNVTTYAYDKLNRKSSETGADPDGAGGLSAPVTTYNYDAAGNLIRVTDPTNKIQTSTFDNLNRKTSDSWVTGKSVSSITRSSSTATVTSTAHGYGNGQVIQISGADQPEYNGLFTITVVDANTFTYTVSGTPASPATGTMFADLQVAGVSYDYDAASNLSGQSDGLGHRTSYAYDNANRKISTTQPDPDGGGSGTSPITAYTYDANNNLLTTTDPDSRVTQSSYDNLNRQTGSFLLDASANIKTISSITRSGSTATVTTSAVHGYTTGDIVRISGANQPEYNGFFVITVTTTTAFTYAVNGTPATPATAHPGQTLQSLKSLQSSRSTYDAANRVINEYDGQNNRTATSYDNDDRKTGEYVMLGTTKSVTSITRSGATVTVTSTAHGYATGNVVQISGATQPEYNGFFFITNTGANTFTYTIDGTPATPATGTIVAENTVQSTRYTYDAASNLISVIDGSANVTKFSYDNMDRQSGEFWMNGTVKSVSSLTRSGSTATVTSTAHGYTSGDVVEIRGAVQSEYNGFVKITVVDANTFTYTVSGTPASPATGTIVAEKTNQNARDEYDANSNDIASTDRNALRRYFVFDKLNRQIEEDWLAAGVAISTITFSSLTATVTTSSAHGYATNDWVEISGVDQLPYDGLFQITVTSSTTFTYTMASSPGTNGTGATKLARKSTRKMSTAYDAAGRISSASDPDSAYAYTYDSAGRLTGTDNNTTPNLPRVILTNSYNAANWRFGLFSTVNGTSDITEIFNHDNIGRTSDIEQYGTGVANKRANFTYNQSGQYTTITRFSDITGTTQVTHSDYVYDSAKRLTSLVHRNAANTALVTYSWVYDNQGRVKTFTNPDGTVTFGYDAASQVTSTSGGTLSESYTYDKSGNRTIAGYTTGADNRLTSDGTYNYTYDSEGNRTRRTKISDSTYIDYTYDYRNRLTDEVYRTSGGVKTKALHYVYDVNDRRIERQLDATGDGVYESKERYIYDGEDIVLVYDGSNALISRYMQGPDFDQPLAEESGGVVKWELPDEQGSIRDMGDNAGALVAGSHVIYNSFGVVTSGTPGRYAYTGREWDADAGMYYYRARWYDANVGRFISQDPKGFDAGDANVYRYVGNSSPNAQDPTGMNAVRSQMSNDAAYWSYVSGVAPSQPASAPRRSSNTMLPYRSADPMAAAVGGYGSHVDLMSEDLYYAAAGMNIPDDGAGRRFNAMMIRAEMSWIKDTTIDNSWTNVFRGFAGGTDREIYEAYHESLDNNPRMQFLRNTGIAIKEFGAHTVAGVGEVQGPPSYKPPAPKSLAGALGRIAGRTIGLGASLGEIVGGGLMTGAAVVEEGGSLGSLSFVAVPQALAGVGVMTFGANGVRNSFKPLDLGGIDLYTAYQTGQPNRPPNLSPPGAGRSGALRQAKRDAGVPAATEAKIREVPDRTNPGKMTYEHDFVVPKEGGGTRTVTIQEHPNGHEFPDNPSQNRGPHFNGPDGGHYDY